MLEANSQTNAYFRVRAEGGTGKFSDISLRIKGLTLIKLFCDANHLVTGHHSVTVAVAYPYHCQDYQEVMFLVAFVRLAG